MMIVKQKDLKNLAKEKLVFDLTNCDFDFVDSFDVLAVSKGIYGVNGCLLKDFDTNQLYVITERNSNLFKII